MPALYTGRYIFPFQQAIGDFGLQEQRLKDILGATGWQVCMGRRISWGQQAGRCAWGGGYPGGNRLAGVRWGEDMTHLALLSLQLLPSSLPRNAFIRPALPLPDAEDRVRHHGVLHVIEAAACHTVNGPPSSGCAS